MTEESKGVEETSNNLQEDNQASKSKDTSSNDALSDEQIELALKDQRTWSHPRIKEALKSVSELKKIKAQQEESKLAKLEEEKKHEELANTWKQKAQDAEQRAQQVLVSAEVKTKAVMQGLVDPDAVLALIDKSKIEVAEDGSITGVDEALSSLVESKPWLKSDQNQKRPIGSSSNPGDESTQQRKFKHSEILDPKFFDKHKSEIIKAMKLGQIEDDLQ